MKNAQAEYRLRRCPGDMSAPIPKNEPERLEALNACFLTGDLPNDPALERFVNAVACALDVPIALVSIVQEKRQYFAARVGLDVDQTQRDVSFCAHAVAAEKPLVVEDALEDARFADNPLVTGGPGIRFYAGVPLFSPHGPAVGTLCVIDTAPRALEPKELGILQNLARSVESHIELRVRAEALGQRLDTRMLGAAVHDLKGPLTAIHGIAELLREDPKLAAERPELLGDLSSSSTRLTRQLYDLLDALAADSPLVSRAREISLSAVVDRVVREQRHRAERGAKSIELIAPKGDLLVLGDAPTLERCVYNLLDNALKHTPGGKSVTIELRTGDEEIIVAVSDPGPGVPPALRKEIFTPGFRADSPRAGSVGLGLASVRLGAERHGGTVRVADTERGARFELLLPRARVARSKAS